MWLCVQYYGYYFEMIVRKLLIFNMYIDMYFLLFFFGYKIILMFCEFVNYGIFNLNMEIGCLSYIIFGISGLYIIEYWKYIKQIMCINKCLFRFLLVFNLLQLYLDDYVLFFVLFRYFLLFYQIFTFLFCDILIFYSEFFYVYISIFYIIYAIKFLVYF